MPSVLVHRTPFCTKMAAALSASADEADKNVLQPRKCINIWINEGGAGGDIGS